MNTGDIVSEMVNDMGMSQDQLMAMQNQGGGGGGAPMPGYGQGGQGIPGTPEEQMRMMSQMQNQMQGAYDNGQQYAEQEAHIQQPGVEYEEEVVQQEAPPPVAYDSVSNSSSESTNSSNSVADMHTLGLDGTKPKSFLDNVLAYLKDPLVVIVLFVIINLAPVDKLFQQYLPALIRSNNYYYLGIKGLILGAAYLTSKLAFQF
jgi:hypothetical protein